MLLKRRKPLLLIALLAVTTTTLPLGLRTLSDETAPAPQPALLAVSAPANAVTNANTTFTEATRQNAVLQNDLVWTFGKKQQRGWYLYVPLISRLIETESDTNSVEFATALARWQRAHGLAALGVLNRDTLYRMMETWQARRLKLRAPARPDQLVIVPASEFYDSSRPDNLRQIERETYAAYQRMLAAAAADRVIEGHHLKIISAHRSRAYQNDLRRKEPHAGSAGLAINSPHFTGRAIDLYVGGDPVDAKDANRTVQIRTRAYRWLVHNAERFGFRPYPYEPWHWEYVG
ncbi:MAG: D-alanyl-D-alanine carboxypeptidase family protein [Acidobacteriota bacterium]|nr:D-alanyl-D-alanine carboxypeptidase family protein [Acidobacteriota bacterium]